MYFPMVGVTAEPWILALIGFTVGVCGGFFGIGGAFLVTPALNILGFPMAYAIGTDLAHITGKSVASAARHWRLGNVDARAGVLLAAGTIPGVEIGSRVVMRLERLGTVESAVRVAYILLLTVIGTGMLADYVRARRQRGEAEAGERKLPPPAAWARRIRWRPLVSLPVSGIESISLWVLLGISFTTGFCAGFLGVGGGFIRMPALLYLVGMPTRVAVGTDLLEVIFSGAYGAFAYAARGRVDLLAALIMLSGAAVGSQIGALATGYVTGYRIRLCFALVVLASAVAVALKQLGYGGPAGVLLLASGSAASLAITIGLLRGTLAERRRAHATF